MPDSSPERAVLICHAEDRVDCEGLAAWLASSFQLVGMVVIREVPVSRLRRFRSEIRRVGLLRALDVLAFRVYRRLRLRQGHVAWAAEQIARLRFRYRTDLTLTPRLSVQNPNQGTVAHFLRRHKPDFVIARCKFLLKPEIFGLPRVGTFVLHPGICPQYRNAHGCFWALVMRDLENVGMTLLKVDQGIDTGPIYLYGRCSFDEVSESHEAIQYRVVIENLDAIAAKLRQLCRGCAHPIEVSNQPSRNWGQPWLTAYLRWKQQARATDA